MRRAMLWVLALALWASCLGGADDAEGRISTNDCIRLREHLIDVQLNGAGGDPALAAQHRAAHRRVLGDAFLQKCTATVDRDVLACGLAAGSGAAIETCALP